MENRFQKNQAAASVTEIVSRLLIENHYFQKFQIPTSSLLYLTNDLLKTIQNHTNPRLSVFQESKILYKNVRGIPLSNAEKYYQQHAQGIDVLGEILTGVKLSSMFFAGQQLIGGITSAVKQGLWRHIPSVAAYNGLSILGPYGLQFLVAKLLNSTKLTKEQQSVITPWLHVIGRLAIGFTPKVQASDNGIHYQYPSTIGHQEFYTSDQAFDAYRLKNVSLLSAESLRLNITNASGDTYPADFHLRNHDKKPMVVIDCADTTLRAYLQSALPSITQIATSMLSVYAASGMSKHPVSLPLALVLPSLMMPLPRAMANAPTIFPLVDDVSNFNGINGVKFNIPLTSQTMSILPDINGDGVDDFIVSQSVANPYCKYNAGTSYILFGSNQWQADVDLSVMTPAKGIVVHGEYSDDHCGISVGSTGDFNNDGFNDVMVYAYRADPFNQINAGINYIIHGRDAGWSSVFNASSISQVTDVTVYGTNSLPFYWVDYYSDINPAGDINGDGFDDILLHTTQGFLGVSLLFGNNNTYSEFNITSIDGINGVDLSRNGYLKGNQLGDINADGYDDFVINLLNSGVNYVLFGHQDWPETIDLKNLTGVNSTTVIHSVYSEVILNKLGDFNGDGFNDIIVGVPEYQNEQMTAVGSVFVIYGHNASWSEEIDLANFNSSLGFQLQGNASDGAFGSAVGSVGDFNKDGFAEMYIGASGLERSYVIFGNNTGWTNIYNITQLSAWQGIELHQIQSRAKNHGDLNGDGFDDILFSYNGGAYALFGKNKSLLNITYTPSITDSPTMSPVSTPAPTPIFEVFDLATLNRSLGFKFSAGNYVRSLTFVSDINRDGYSDFAIGLPNISTNTSMNVGGTALVFGTSDWQGTMNLTHLDGSCGVLFIGENANDFSGIYIGGGGDLNGDGFDDLLVGATGVDPYGVTYVIAGKESYNLSVIELASINGANGYKIIGTKPPQLIGHNVGISADINGDSVPDIIMNSQWGGATYHILYGHPFNVGDVALNSTIDSSKGFTIINADYSSNVNPIKGSIDINGDGYTDLILGFPFTQINGKLFAGETFVVFGQPNNRTNPVDLKSLNHSDGIRITGVGYEDDEATGYAVNPIGDINGDGYPDFAMSAPEANVGCVSRAGKVYVLFGHSNSWPSLIDLANLADIDSVIINGFNVNAYFGRSLSGIGDVNGDGIDDLAIGTADSSAGKKIFILFGRQSVWPPVVNIADMTKDQGWVIEGAGLIADKAGDINGDGANDIVIADRPSGNVYAIFGKRSPVDSSSPSRSPTTYSPSFLPTALPPQPLSPTGSNTGSSNVVIILLASLGVGAVLIPIVTFLLCKRRQLHKIKDGMYKNYDSAADLGSEQGHQSLQDAFVQSSTSL